MIESKSQTLVTSSLEGEPLQQIYYGAPGTGKSHEAKQKTKGHAVVRTTFHPDSDYSTFVGAYKPTMTQVRKSVVIGQDEKEVKPLNGNSDYESKIQYSFVKQAFLKAYLGAWQKYAAADDKAEPQFLVIEEINRGNCAQIFGDLFQLLDRADNKFSTYPIEADADLQQAIATAFAEKGDYALASNLNIEGAVEDYTSNYGSTLSEDVQQGRVMLLPPNLYIWATMNTSDQSLFPIDSAFKRRWDWQYVRITEGREEDKKTPKLVHVDVLGKQYDWWSFIQQINERIFDITKSEDKKLGYWFCKSEDKSITAERFVSKVCFYLWNDVFKSYGFGKDNTFKQNGKDIAFDQFYQEDPETFETKVNETLVDELMQALHVETLEERKACEADEKNENTVA